MASNHEQQANPRQNRAAFDELQSYRPLGKLRDGTTPRAVNISRLVAQQDAPYLVNQR